MKTKLDFLKMKESEEPIVMLTAYDYPAAKLAEQAGVDMIMSVIHLEWSSSALIQLSV